MARIQIAFQCTHCTGWNYPYLRDNMTGNYTIECGGCKHHHYRTVQKGVVTEDRHSQKYGVSNLIIILPSQFSKKARTRGRIAEIRELQAAGMMR